MKKQMKNGNLYFIFALLVMAVLFYSSSMTYQAQSQVSTIDHVLKNQPFHQQLAAISFQYAGKEISISALGYGKFIEFYIRKGAHFTTYFLLGGSLYLGLLTRLKNSQLIGLGFAWLAATGYAATDEFHQMLTGDRTPLFQDVMLDSCGALTACLLLLFWQFFTKKRVK